MTSLNKVFGQNAYKEEAPEVDFGEFEKVVTSRRSVRRFLSTPIPDDIVRKCLSLALLAPNSSNLQPWEFHWVKSDNTKKELDTAFLSQPAVTTAPTLIVAVARTATWKPHAKEMSELIRKEDPRHSALSYYEKIVPFVYSVGFLRSIGLIKKMFLTCMGFFKPVPREPTSNSELKTWAVKTTALACENLMLSLRAAGYDSCPMEGFDGVRVKRILQLPTDAVIVMGISAGKRADNGVYGPQLRFDEDRFIHEV